MAIRQKFEVFSGNDVTLEVALTDEQTESPLVLIGTQELEWAVSRRGSSAILLQKSLDDGITIVDSINGQISIAMSAADTEDLQGVYYHELRIVNEASKRITLMYGPCEFKANLIQE